MSRVEQKLIELGYRVSMTQTIGEIVVKTWLKEIDAINFHWVQTIDGKLMGVMSDKPKQMQKDLKILKECEE